MIIKKKPRTVIPPLEADTYSGTLIGVVDLGEQEFMKKFRREVLLIFEIAGEYVDVEQDGKTEKMPRWLSRRFTASIDPKSNLYACLSGWKGSAIEDEEFDLSTLLGAPALLNVTVQTSKDGNPYNLIQGIMKPMRGMDIPAPESEILDFDMERPETWDVLDKLPEWMKEAVERSSTWAALQKNTGETITPEAFKGGGELPFDTKDEKPQETAKTTRKRAF